MEGGAASCVRNARYHRLPLKLSRIAIALGTTAVFILLAAVAVIVTV